MPSIAEIQAEQQRVAEELIIVAEKLRASKGTDDSLFTQRAQLQRRRSELVRELAAATNESPATGTFQGLDPNTGLYLYTNPVTGGTFRSGTPPTAEQQAASGISIDPPAQPEPPATASQTAQDDAPKGPNAPEPAQVNASGRIVAPPDTTAPSNAETPTTSDTGGDSGTDAPVRTTEQTQATNGYDQGINVRAEDGTLSSLRKNPETGELYDPGGQPGGVDLTTQSGTSTNDDAADNSTSTKQTEINATNTSLVKIIPQPNVLDDYYSYTYVASVYLVNDAQYKRLIETNNKKLDGYQLLFQSGGAPINVGGQRPPPAGDTTVYENGGQASTVPPPEINYPDGGRSPFFDNDFYIDSISLVNKMPAGGTGAPHFDTDLKFTVVEPQGMTLFDRLRDAVANHAPRDGAGKVNYIAATYLMVIRFYGYDQNGNLVSPIKGSMYQGSDTKAVVEKFIPFQIQTIDWTVGSKTVSYDWKCKPVGQNIAGTIARGTIPYDLQLNAVTVEKLLSGTAKFATTTASTAKPGAPTTTGNQSDANQSDAETRRLASANAAAAPAPPTAAAAPSPSNTIVQGLMQAMNDFQQKLVYDGIYEQADNYSIEFVGPGSEKISGAVLLQADDKIDKTKTPGGSATTSSGGTKNLNPDTNKVINNSRSFSITAGQQILQVIDLVVRNSSYISSQALFTIDADGNQIPTKNPNYNQPVTWYTITMSATPRSNKLDGKRNDYAYNIKYTVSPYLIKNLNSVYFPVNKFSGVHKSYPYWFTGQNTAILEYQETLNAWYKASMSGSIDNTTTAQQVRNAVTSSLQEILMYTYVTRSGESSAGALGKSFELAANATELLYDTAGLRNAKLKIIGDPAWIAQGSLFRPVNQETFGGKALTQGFMPDGSIAFDNQEILFEIVWQRPEDYDLSTGLADPYSATQKKYNNRLALQSRVYIATSITSEFRQGRFEQTVEGKLYNFTKPDGSNAANASVAALATNAAGGDAGRGKDNGKNVTKETFARAGRAVPTDAEARKARADFAAKDPRRLDTGDGGKRAMLGAQGAYKEATFTENGGGAAFGNPNITRQGITAGATLQPANPPTPATDGTGGSLSTTSVVAEEVASGPPKLPNTGRPVTPGSLRARQIQDTVDRLKAQAGNPTSTTNPSRQQIVKD